MFLINFLIITVLRASAVHILNVSSRYVLRNPQEVLLFTAKANSRANSRVPHPAALKALNACPLDSPISVHGAGSPPLARAIYPLCVSQSSFRVFLIKWTFP